MKRIAVALFAALIASALTAATPASVPVPDKGPNNGWIVNTSKQHDHLLLLKVRSEVPADVQPSKYPNALEMHWKYTPDAKGMPSEKVVTQIAKFEATLDPLQGDRVGYLMMIVTGSASGPISGTPPIRKRLAASSIASFRGTRFRSPSTPLPKSRTGKRIARCAKRCTDIAFARVRLR
jgi:hypothetical protein